MDKGQDLISFIYFDKNPQMKLISFIDVTQDVSSDSFIEEVSGVEDAA